MSTKKWFGLLIAMVMLVATASPVFAQGETDPPEEPAVVEESYSFADHPIVKLLASFFNSLFVAPEVEEPVEEEGGEALPPETTEDPDSEGGEAVEEPILEPTLAPEEQVAALHTDEDLGFGEITKLLQIVSEAQASCAAEGINCDVTLDSLLEEYESGNGMGDLFAKYGKPEITGVGQVKNGDKETEEKSNNGKANGKNK